MQEEADRGRGYGHGLHNNIEPVVAPLLDLIKVAHEGQGHEKFEDKGCKRRRVHMGKEELAQGTFRQAPPGEKDDPEGQETELWGGMGPELHY